MYQDLTSFASIKSYVMIELTGSDVDDEAYFEIPLNDKELLNILDNSFRDFMNWGYDGLEEGFYVLEIPENKPTEYTVPSHIQTLTYEIRLDIPSRGHGGTSLDYTDFIRSGIFYMGGNQVYTNQLDNAMMNYFMQQNIVIENIRNIFRPMGQYTFNPNTHKLTLLTKPTSYEYKIFRCYYSPLLKTYDPDEEGASDNIIDETDKSIGSYMNTMLLRRLVLARAKKKLGWNGKYIKTLTVSNYTIDFDAIYNEGKEEEEKIMEELKGQASWSIIVTG